MNLEGDGFAVQEMPDVGLHKGAKRLDGSLKWVTALLILSWLVAVALWVSFGLSVRLPGAAWPPALLAINQNATWQALAAVLAIGSLATLLIWRYQALARSAYRTEAGCPRCLDRDFVRVPRRAFERTASTTFLLPTQRFTCRNCGWEGLLVGQSEDAILADLALLASAELAAPATVPKWSRVSAGSSPAKPIAGTAPQNQPPANSAVGKNGSIATTTVAATNAAATRPADGHPTAQSANGTNRDPGSPSVKLASMPQATGNVGSPPPAPLSMWELYDSTDTGSLRPPYASAETPATTSVGLEATATKAGKPTPTQSVDRPGAGQLGNGQQATFVPSQSAAIAPGTTSTHGNGTGSKTDAPDPATPTGVPAWAARAKTEVQSNASPPAAQAAATSPTVTTASTASTSAGTRSVSTPVSATSVPEMAQATPAVPDPSTLKWPAAPGTQPASHPKAASPTLVTIQSEKFDPSVPQAVVTAPYGLKLRAEPEASAAVLGLLPAEAIVKLLDAGNGEEPTAWQRVQAGGKTGWVAAALLRRLPGKR